MSFFFLMVLSTFERETVSQPSPPFKSLQWAVSTMCSCSLPSTGYHWDPPGRLHTSQWVPLSGSHLQMSPAREHKAYESDCVGPLCQSLKDHHRHPAESTFQDLPPGCEPGFCRPLHLVSPLPLVPFALATLAPSPSLFPPGDLCIRCFLAMVLAQQVLLSPTIRAHH